MALELQLREELAGERRLCEQGVAKSPHLYSWEDHNWDRDDRNRIYQDTIICALHSIISGGCCFPELASVDVIY
jgi:hypothetical protein